MKRPKNKSRSDKQPKVAKEPAYAKTPYAKNTPEIEGGHLAWRFSACDRGGRWAWTNLQPAEKYKETVEKLHAFEKMNWNQILDNGCHPISLGDIAKEAHDRLREINMDDLDELMSFRLSGKNRVWCVRSKSIMRILWWDPDHTVCPALKKHT